MIKRGPPARYPPRSPANYPSRFPSSYQRKPTNNPFINHFPSKEPPKKTPPSSVSKSTKFLATIVVLFMLVGIIFLIIKGISKDKPDEEDEIEKFTADLRISNAQLLNYSDIHIKINEPDEEDNFEFIVFIFYDNDSEITRRKIPLEKLEDANFQMVFHFANASMINKISIIPVFEDENGDEVEGEVEDQAVVEIDEENNLIPEEKENETFICKSDSQCDDKNNCTTNKCLSNGNCSYQKINNCASCSFNSDCEDLNACTANICSRGVCTYLPTPGCIACYSNSSCEDNNPCTDNICMGGRCLYNPISNCNPSNTNTTNTSNTIQCTVSNQATTCNDNNICTTDLCISNVCVNNAISNCLTCTSVQECNDGNSCTRDICSNNKCFYNNITTCVSNDGCCPSSCGYMTDNDCPAICGNNVREGDEKCDGTSLGGATCAGILGTGYTGTLLCSGCMFNTSLCASPCAETCASLNYQCGTRAICGGSVNCGTCPIGYSCNINGTCMNLCTPESNAAFCNRLNRECESFTSNDNCGNPRTVYCGTCLSTESCSNGICISVCTSHSSSDCYNGDVYWYNSCGTREEIRDDCTSTQTCSNGQCVTSTPATYCGDGGCNGEETCSSCSVDCGSCQTYLRTFYVSSSEGNDDNTGTSQSSPWRTLTKVNSQTFRAGDAILFKRGDTFYGSLTVSSSGSSSAPITYGAYGTGNKPVISGFRTLTGWVSSGGGTYYKGVSTQSSPLIVTVNGKNTPKGRWPNTGWLLFDSYSGYTSITDSQLSGRNFVNGEVVIRVAKWITYRAGISSHSGSTVYFPWELGGDYALKTGQGYFIQNDVDTFDIIGDWAYVNGNLYMYFGSNTPSNYDVKVSTLDTFAALNNREYITFDNLYIEGYNIQGIEVRNSRHITITNCEFQNMGGSGIYGPWDGDSSYMRVENCKFIENNNCGIKVFGDHENAIIRYNTLKNIGMIDGLGGIKDGSAIGITTDASNTLISNNNMEYIGYNGVSFRGENSKVTNNFINHFCQKKDDCGGIYTYEDSGTGKQILDNIVLDGLNHNEGIDESSDDFHSHGIYIDGSDNVRIYRNTVAHNEGAGIFLNTQALGIDLQNNLAFDNVRGIQIISNWRGMGEITGAIIRNNIFVAKESTQHTLYYTTGSGDEGVRSLGSVDYNYYARPIDDTKSFRNQIYLWGGPTTYRTLAEWQAYSGLDSNSKKSPKSISSTSDLRFEYNPTSSSKTISLDRNYIDIKGESYSGSLTLQPYSSIVLIRD